MEYDPSIEAPGYDEYLEDAEVTKNEYNFQIITLLNKFGIKTEAELATGCIVKFRRQYAKKKKTYDNVQRVKEAMQSLRQSYLLFPPPPHPPLQCFSLNKSG